MKINWFVTICLLLALAFTVISIQGMFSESNLLSILPALASIGLIVIAVFRRKK